MTLPLDQEHASNSTIVHPSTSTITIDKSKWETTETVSPPNPPKQDEVRTHASITPVRTERCQLEDYTAFAHSHLWKLMMSFYDRQGVESWALGIVPHFITSNTFIAKRYSQVFRAYVRDCMRTASVSISISFLSSILILVS